MDILYASVLMLYDELRKIRHQDINFTQKSVKHQKVHQLI